MSDDSLPADLVEIEKGIAARRVEDPSSGLRARVMFTVSRTLASEAKQSADSGRRWGYAAALAATLLIGANLARVGASVTTFVRPAPPTYAQVLATAQTLRQLSPELTADEAARMSATLLAAGNVPCVPEIRGVRGR